MIFPHIDKQYCPKSTNQEQMTNDKCYSRATTVKLTWKWNHERKGDLKDASCRPYIFWTRSQMVVTQIQITMRRVGLFIIDTFHNCCMYVCIYVCRMRSKIWWLLRFIEIFVWRTVFCFMCVLNHLFSSSLLWNQ